MSSLKNDTDQNKSLIKCDPDEYKFYHKFSDRRSRKIKLIVWNSVLVKLARIHKKYNVREMCVFLRNQRLIAFR